MRLSDATIRAIAHTCYNELRSAVNYHRQLDDQIILRALAQARAAGRKVPMVSSARSLQMISDEFIEVLS